MGISTVVNRLRPEQLQVRSVPPVAQSVFILSAFDYLRKSAVAEHWSYEPKVASSSLAWGTRVSGKFFGLFGFGFLVFGLSLFFRRRTTLMESPRVLKLQVLYCCLCQLLVNENNKAQLDLHLQNC